MSVAGAGIRTEGSPPFWARSIAPQPCIRLDQRRIPTMKQPFAPAARLRGGGPILTTVLWTMFRLGSPSPRIEVPELAAQPARKHAHQHHRIEPVHLCPPVFARNSDTRWMDDVLFDDARPEPPRQPETITAGLKGGGNARHRRPVFAASSCHRCSTRSSACSSGEASSAAAVLRPGRPRRPASSIVSI